MYKLTGILIAFISPALHSWSNILDGYFSNKIFIKVLCIEIYKCSAYHIIFIRNKVF